ncbi:MAG TPA: cation-translocating P-type ATPase [Candidatus Faecenecus gallistercoris]|uniref:P-type Cu(+) transporter n=1 Tax=Candidatus Faecenecus gallistercoris TaxID=2840793 RepID=A0A9D1CJV8_9FIRM|nr:cation-translocating P-type ATPase [Candidatus Faecenecus gallistercoris]
MKKVVLRIGGMTCSACSSGLEKYLSRQEGVSSASVNLVLSLATIEYENLSKKDLERFVKEAGFQSLGEFKGVEDLESKKEDKTKYIVLGILILIMMYLGMGEMLGLPTIPFLNMDYPVLLSSVLLLITIVYLIFGFDILKSGFTNLIHRMPNMDTLVLFSVFFSLAYSLFGYVQIILGNLSYMHHLYFESAAMVLYFVKLGRYIESFSKDQTKSAIRKLVQITPSKAIVKDGEKLTEVTIDEVSTGDTLVCRAGDKVAVDGTVTSGKTYVDESFITGESAPVLKTSGSKVIAGSICYDGYIEYSAEKIGKESTISEIVTMVVDATNTKSKVQKMADRISGYFVPIILAIAIVTFILSYLLGCSFSVSFTHFVTALVVACPCALGLAVPLVVVVSNGLCAEKGLFLRNGEVLERAKTIDTIVLDKTGTLTQGKLRVYEFQNDSNLTDAEFLNVVANLESFSSHPIHTAFDVTKKLDVSHFEELSGMGILAKINDDEYYLGNHKILTRLKLKNRYQTKEDDYSKAGCSIIYVVQNKKLIGIIGVKDTVREESKEAIREFMHRGIDVVMLTGDHEGVANQIAKEVGIRHVISDVLPKEKASYIEKLKQDGKHVIMVGDGINDAPALVASSIGISINQGTDVAMDSADVILMNNNLSNIIDFIDISKQSYHIIWQNLFWAFFYNALMIPIAAGLLLPLGITMNPMVASIAMTISSLTVVMNSLRLRRWKNERN